MLFVMTDPLRNEDEISKDVEIPLVPAAEDEPWDAVVLDLEAQNEHDQTLEPAAIATAPAADLVVELRALGERIERRVDGLQTLLEREARAEATREKVVDRLHAELQEYKQDLLLNTLRPVFIDLIQLHDDIGKVAMVPDGEDGSGELRRMVVLMQGFQQGIEDILYRQGVEPFHVEGETFDPRRQRAVVTVPTEDSAVSKTVAERLRKGFRSGDRVIRPEIVSVYALKKTT